MYELIPSQNKVLVTSGGVISVRLPENNYSKAKNIGLRYGMSQITHTATLNL